MKATFMPLGRDKLAREKLSRCRQKNGESVTEYTNRIRGLSESEKLDRYVRGLIPCFREKVFMDEPANFGEAVKRAAKYHALKYGLQHTNVEVGSNSDPHGAGDMEVDAVRMHKPYPRC